MGTLLNTKEAAEYLTAHGKQTREATLNSLRSTGGGPPFLKAPGRKHVFYDSDDLDKWANYRHW